MQKESVLTIKLGEDIYIARMDFESRKLEILKCERVGLEGFESFIKLVKENK